MYSAPDGEILAFGKHRGRRFSEVASFDPGYIQWAAALESQVGQLLRMVEWCEHCGYCHRQGQSRDRTPPRCIARNPNPFQGDLTPPRQQYPFKPDDRVGIRNLRRCPHCNGQVASICSVHGSSAIVELPLAGKKRLQVPLVHLFPAGDHFGAHFSRRKAKENTVCLFLMEEGFRISREQLFKFDDGT